MMDETPNVPKKTWRTIRAWLLRVIWYALSAVFGWHVAAFVHLAMFWHDPRGLAMNNRPSISRIGWLPFVIAWLCQSVFLVADGRRLHRSVLFGMVYLTFFTFISTFLLQGGTSSSPRYQYQYRQMLDNPLFQFEDLVVVLVISTMSLSVMDLVRSLKSPSAPNAESQVTPAISEPQSISSNSAQKQSCR